MESNVVLAAIAGLCTIIFIWLWFRKSPKLPPGPIGLPILGYLPFVGKEAYVTFHHLALEYGPIFSLYLGRKLVVVLGNFETMKEGYSNNNLLDRPPHPPNHLLPNSTSLTISGGRTWKEQRDFSIQLLRGVGMGRNRMEDIIQNEIKHMLKILKNQNGRPFNLDDILTPSVSNNVYTLLTGHRLDYENPDRQFLNTMLRTMVMFFRPTRVHAYFPWLRKWLIKFGIWEYDIADAVMRQFGKFAEKLIYEHESSLKGTKPENYIDGYLMNVKKHEKEDTTFTRKMLKGNFQSFLGAGSTPPRAAIDWAIISMITYPHIMERLQEEIDSVVGKDRLPEWEDRKSMPYTMAVIHEVLRHYSIIPVSMLRCASDKCKIGEYDIPKGTIVVANLWGIHHHPDDWEKPYEFNPDRFIEDGKFIYPTKGYAPLSYGKRNCPGEELAYMEMFLYLTGILQNFSISIPEKSPKSFEQQIGVAKLVIPDNICLISRS